MIDRVWLAWPGLIPEATLPVLSCFFEVVIGIGVASGLTIKILCCSMAIPPPHPTEPGQGLFGLSHERRAGSAQPPPENVPRS